LHGNLTKRNMRPCKTSGLDAEPHRRGCTRREREEDEEEEDEEEEEQEEEQEEEEEEEGRVA